MSKERDVNPDNWAIAENIHTIPGAAFSNTEGEWNFLDWNSKSTGGNAV